MSEAGIQKKEVKDGPKRGLKGKLSSGQTQEGSPRQKLQQGWTNPDARKQLVIGINEVTRALERDELCLVLVCKSVKPRHMTNHLITLSKTRQVPACQVPRLSENMAGVLGLKCVLALGFKRNTEIFSQTVSAIVPRVPQFQVPWILAQVKEQEHTRDHAMETGQTDEAENESKAQGQKRKLEETGILEHEATSTLPLQPLKVKKIIPNPKPKHKRNRLWNK
ncbi:hypothetical protein JZ751_015699 [Albula glossodonta]|uniref:Ribosomal protein eL8/eL30/eS12/Gadd45 domain-containing protein n=1 Tax=Albula glossodonta TaxID=121402 RepID=A0A8T2P2E2_9TELE|nr:hypothetical protein JZ751_015699 [Albula glossodonta]